MAFNQLTSGEIERLALLAEECGEVLQIIGKVLRHGYESYHPDDTRLTNRDLLTKELGDLSMAMDLMAARGDVDGAKVAQRQQEKYDRVRQYLHHNTIPERDGVPFHGAYARVDRPDAALCGRSGRTTGWAAGGED